MPGQLKEVRTRIRSVQSTQQITKAMKMVSASKLRRATDRIIKMRPYANKMREILSNIVSGTGVTSPLVKERGIKKVLVVVVTSDRGLAGAFNSTLIKMAKLLIAEKYEEQKKAGQITVMPVGKRAADAFRRAGHALKPEFSEMFLHLSFEESLKASQWMMQAYMDGEFDAIDIVYAEFKNAATQVFKVESFLPLQRPSGEKKRTIDFIFEPEQDELVNQLIPKILNTQFFKVLLDSNASEHGARMTAMDKATENAHELLKDLSVKYNRARQAAITTELSEIVGGAAALEG